MSLIHKIAAIIDNQSVDDIHYFDKSIVYQEDINLLDIDWRNILPQPPLNSSSEVEKELRFISKQTKNRSSKDIELIYKVDKDPLILFYEFTDKHNLIFPKNKFDNLYNIIEQYVYALKIYFNRARPEQVAPYYNIDINIINTDTHHTPSYPGGHTMYSELAAHILSEIYPVWKKEFFQLSSYCATARILQGVHYPSDNKASIIATEKLFNFIRNR
jgi:hypothetical protein